MGFVRKITGVQGQIDAANENNRMQLEAATKAQEAAASASAAQAQAAADQQRMIAEREAIQQAVSDSLNKPREVADVQVDAAGTNSAGSTRKRRAQFNRTYSGGSGARV